MMNEIKTKSYSKNEQIICANLIHAYPVANLHVCCYLFPAALCLRWAYQLVNVDYSHEMVKEKVKCLCIDIS